MLISGIVEEVMNIPPAKLSPGRIAAILSARKGALKGQTVRRTCIALIAALLLTSSLTACSRTLYTFPNLPKNLPSTEKNLLSDPGFEDASVKICTFNCNASSGWSIEHSTAAPPSYYRTQTGAVTGSYAESLIYKGSSSDNGMHKEIELYQGAVSSKTTTGYRLTFTLWISGTCINCAPFIGIEAFDAGNNYLGESDQYFFVPETPRPVQVSYLLPAGTAAVAAYIQVPEIYSVSRSNLNVDNASLTVGPGLPICMPPQRPWEGHPTNLDARRSLAATVPVVAPCTSTGRR